MKKKIILLALIPLFFVAIILSIGFKNFTDYSNESNLINIGLDNYPSVFLTDNYLKSQIINVVKRNSQSIFDTNHYKFYTLERDGIVQEGIQYTLKLIKTQKSNDLKKVYDPSNIISQKLVVGVVGQQLEFVIHEDNKDVVIFKQDLGKNVEFGIISKGMHYGEHGALQFIPSINGCIFTYCNDASRISKLKQYFDESSGYDYIGIAIITPYDYLNYFLGQKQNSNIFKSPYGFSMKDILIKSSNDSVSSFSANLILEGCRFVIHVDCQLLRRNKEVFIANKKNISGSPNQDCQDDVNKFDSHISRYINDYLLNKVISPILMRKDSLYLKYIYSKDEIDIPIVSDGSLDFFDDNLITELNF